MPRTRLLLPDIFHHITQRGNRRQQTFFDREDYECYLNFLWQFCKNYLVEIISFCLMPNHVHLILKSPTGSSIRDAIADTHESYTKNVNFRKGWRGHLWQGRFFSCPLSPSHFDHTLNYIAENPVRSNLCEHPMQYQWNSCRKEFRGKFPHLIMPSFIKSFTESERKEFAKASRTGSPFGEKKFFKELEAKLNLKLLYGKAGRPEKK